MLPRAGYGKSLLIEKFFYTQDIFNIFVAIHPLSRTALHWLELRKLRFPETKNVCRQTAELSDLSNPEIEFVRDYHFGGLDRFSRGFVARTHLGSRSGLHRRPRLTPYPRF